MDEIQVEEKVSKVFSALSDRTRRSIIDELQKKDCTIKELATLFDDMSFQAVSKHVKVLDDAGLISREKKGRFQICQYTPQSILPALSWIAQHQQLWKDNFDALEQFLDQEEKKK